MHISTVAVLGTSSSGSYPCQVRRGLGWILRVLAPELRRPAGGSGSRRGGPRPKIGDVPPPSRRRRSERASPPASAHQKSALSRPASCRSGPPPVGACTRNQAGPHAPPRWQCQRACGRARLCARSRPARQCERPRARPSAGAACHGHIMTRWTPRVSFPAEPHARVPLPPWQRDPRRPPAAGAGNRQWMSPRGPGGVPLSDRAGPGDVRTPSATGQQAARSSGPEPAGRLRG